MSLLSSLLLLIWLCVWRHLWRSYYYKKDKILWFILLLFASFCTAWLALKYADGWLRETSSRHALWTWFILSSALALISLILWARSWCGIDWCWCLHWGICTLSEEALARNEIRDLSPWDDLKLIEWIWPIIEEHLYANWIKTYEQLADQYPIHLKNILDRAGDRFSIHSTDTWPMQAGLARDKNWDDLKLLQEKLKWWKSS